MSIIHNPIISGFNLASCIFRLGEEYFIANYNFEWFLGIALYHSRGLAHWYMIGHALMRSSKLDLRGVQSSEGVWAPNLSHCEADLQLYLTYTVMRNWGYDGPRDMHNYFVASNSIEGPWSDPIYLDTGGIDSLFFLHPDGRTSYLRNCWDYRTAKDHFAGIVMQEFERERETLIGESCLIYKGFGLGKVEGFHLYYCNGNYLLTAKCGTIYDYAVTLALSHALWGPYEVHPSQTGITSRFFPKNPLQKAGHGLLVQDHYGIWYLAHLYAGPLPSRVRCILGRDAALQKVVWKEDDWLYLAQGGIEPAITIEAENHVGQPWEPENSRNDFDDSVLSPMYQMLRCKLDERFCNLTEREGYLRLRGKETVTSWFEQTLVVRRQTSFYNQMEGLIAFYDHRQFFYIAVTYQDGPVIKLYCCKQSVWIESIKAVPLGNSERVYIRMNTHYDHLQCSYSMYETVWNTLGPWFDSSILSDEYLQPMHIFRSVCGSVCSALDGSDFVADFDYFTYEELDDAF